MTEDREQLVIMAGALTMFVFSANSLEFVIP